MLQLNSMSRGFPVHLPISLWVTTYMYVAIIINLHYFYLLLHYRNYEEYVPTMYCSYSLKVLRIKIFVDFVVYWAPMEILSLNTFYSCTHLRAIFVSGASPLQHVTNEENIKHGTTLITVTSLTWMLPMLIRFVHYTQ